MINLTKEKQKSNFVESVFGETFSQEETLLCFLPPTHLVQFN